MFIFFTVHFYSVTPDLFPDRDGLFLGEGGSITELRRRYSSCSRYKSVWTWQTLITVRQSKVWI